MYKMAFNTTNSSIVIDTDGRSLGGGDWGAIDTVDDAAKPTIESGDVVTFDGKLGKDADPRAVEASEQTALYTKRAAALRDLDDGVLDDLVGAAGYNADTNKTERVAFLARRTSVELPEPEPAKTSSSTKTSKE